jgi:hypothetical protein
VTFHDTPESLRLDVHQRDRAHWLAIGRTEQEWWDWRDELQRRLTQITAATPSDAELSPHVEPLR